MVLFTDIVLSILRTANSSQTSRVPSTITTELVELSACCASAVVITLRASEAAAQCIVISPVCGFVCVCVGLLPQ